MRLLNPQKTLLGIFVLLAVIFLGFEYNRTADLNLYLSASKNLFSTVNLYHPLYGDPPLFFYLGNPFVSLLFHPLSYIPTQAAALLWKAFSLLGLYRIWKIVESFLNEQALRPKQKSIWIIISFAACLLFIYSNLHLVQLTIVMFYLAMEGLHQIFHKEKNTLGAILISLSIGIKLSPVVLLPYLLWRGKMKSIIISLLSLMVLAILPALFMGWEKCQFLWQEWWAVVNAQGEETIFDLNNRKNHGISAWLSTLFIKDITDNVVTLENRRYLIDLGKENVIYLIHITRIFLLVLTFYFIGLKPFQQAKSKLHQFWELSYLFLVIPLFFPQQRVYNFLFLMPALAYLCFTYLNRSTKGKDWTIYAFVALVLLLNLEIILGAYRHYFWHFKSLTYASLGILSLLMILKPKEKS